MSTDNIKLHDAAFFLQDIQSLPYDQRAAVKELYNDTVSRKIIFTTIKELIERLKLEYEPRDFIKNSMQYYYDLTTYLSHFNLKPAPCNIPTGLEFRSNILIAKKPDIRNDPDITQIQSFMNKRDNLTKRDQVVISRANLKLYNYNVFLRLFEALYLVTNKQTLRLDSNQCDELNRILTESELPFEGRAYLKACFSFATSHGVYYTNYSLKKYCFKELDKKGVNVLIDLLLRLLQVSNIAIQIPDDCPLGIALKERISQLPRYMFKTENMSVFDLNPKQPQSNEENASPKHPLERKYAQKRNYYFFENIPTQTDERQNVDHILTSKKKSLTTFINKLSESLPKELFALFAIWFDKSTLTEQTYATFPYPHSTALVCQQYENNKSPHYVNYKTSLLFDYQMNKNLFLHDDDIALYDYKNYCRLVVVTAGITGKGFGNFCYNYLCTVMFRQIFEKELKDETKAALFYFSRIAPKCNLHDPDQKAFYFIYVIQKLITIYQKDSHDSIRNDIVKNPAFYIRNAHTLLYFLVDPGKKLDGQALFVQELFFVLLEKSFRRFYASFDINDIDLLPYFMARYSIDDRFKEAVAKPFDALILAIRHEKGMLQKELTTAVKSHYQGNYVKANLPYVFILDNFFDRLGALLFLGLSSIARSEPENLFMYFDREKNVQEVNRLNCFIKIVTSDPMRNHSSFIEELKFLPQIKQYLFALLLNSASAVNRENEDFMEVQKAAITQCLNVSYKDRFTSFDSLSTPFFITLFFFYDVIVIPEPIFLKGPISHKFIAERFEYSKHHDMLRIKTLGQKFRILNALLKGHIVINLLSFAIPDNIKNDFAKKLVRLLKLENNSAKMICFNYFTKYISILNQMDVDFDEKITKVTIKNTISRTVAQAELSIYSIKSFIYNSAYHVDYDVNPSFHLGKNSLQTIADLIQELIADLVELNRYNKNITLKLSKITRALGQDPINTASILIKNQPVNKVDKLNLDLIKLKQLETAELQAVIGKIKEDNEKEAVFDVEKLKAQVQSKVAKPTVIIPVASDSTYNNTDVDLNDDNKDNKDTAVTATKGGIDSNLDKSKDQKAKTSADGQNGDLIDELPLQDDNCKAFIREIIKDKSETIAFSKLKELSLQYGFMSYMVPIEMINDAFYEKYEEPFLDLDTESETCYISLYLLES